MIGFSLDLPGGSLRAPLSGAPSVPPPTPVPTPVTALVIEGDSITFAGGSATGCGRDAEKSAGGVFRPNRRASAGAVAAEAVTAMRIAEKMICFMALTIIRYFG